MAALCASLSNRAALCASLSNIAALCASFVYTAILSLFRSGGQFPYQLLTRKVNAEQSSAILTTLLSQLDSHMERFITPVGWGL